MMSPHYKSLQGHYYEIELTKREINRQRWLERITDWQQSGLSQKAYCAIASPGAGLFPALASDIHDGGYIEGHATGCLFTGQPGGAQCFQLDATGQR